MKDYPLERRAQTAYPLHVQLNGTQISKLLQTIIDEADDDYAGDWSII
jgi:hypothetical protein